MIHKGIDMKIGNKSFDINKTHIMGILNVTPDSFSDGGRWNTVDGALHCAERMINDGAAIIDIGGESTRPNYTPISDDEEIRRTAPIIEAIKKAFDVPVSIDTYKSAVAHAALHSGADMINDIWGLKYDKKIADEAKRSDAAICLVHNRKKSVYNDFLDDVLSDLRSSINIATKHGIALEKIITDPGIGFAKTYKENLIITNNLDKLHELGCPILYGASRKSMIGNALDLPVDQRLEGTIALSVLACMKGAMFVRVHDVKENYRAVKMIETIIRQ